MSIVTFWNDGKRETGQTMSMAAIATRMAMKHNYKTVLINTKYNDTTLEEGFWGPNVPKAKTDIVTGISGLTKAILSNKTSPEIISNYTKAMLKGGRLELLTDKEVEIEEYEKQKSVMKSMIKMANKYYDLVFVDLEGSLEDPFITGILEQSNLIIPTITQRIQDINKYISIKNKNELFQKENTFLLIGKYDKHLMCNKKNTERYIKDQINEKDVYVIPYSTMYFESCNQGQIIDYIYKFIKIKPGSPQAPVIEALDQIYTRIIEKLREMQMKIY